MYSAVEDAKMVLNLDDVEKTKHFIFSRSLKKKTEVTGNPYVLLNVSILATNTLKND